MKKNILIPLIVITTVLSILSNNCKNRDNIKIDKLPEKVFPLVIEREKAIKIDIITKEPPIIADISDSDHIYIYFLINKDKNCEVFKVTNNLEIKDRYIINYGSGPGETLNPRIYGGNDRLIIVYDLMTRKFIEFDRNFKSIAEYRSLKSLGTPFYSGEKYLLEQGIIIDGFKYIESMSKESDGTLTMKFYNRIYARHIKPDKSIKDIKLFETPLLEERWENNIMPVFRDLNFGYYFDYIYILDKMNYRIIKMTIDGKILKEKQFAFEAKTFSKSELEEWVTKFFGIKEKHEFSFPKKLFPACWMMPIANGIAVGKCKNYDPDDKGEISADYFDPDLNYLGKITIPYFWSWNNPAHGQNEAYNRFLYKNGKLYSIEIEEDLNDFQIVRWGVHIEN
ncbi:MAG: hypothetical protein MUF15_21515 [Acidobacteria bacterium]|nr:hypothetical protein [Acidobacteriota bacterium]